MIGYLGPVNSFTHQALLAYNPSSTAKEYPSIRSLFVALRNHEVDRIVVPIENSTEGSVTTTIDALYDEDVYITDELYLPVQLHLYGNNLDSVTHVMSHPQALAQCRNRLDSLLGSYIEVPTASTAQAIEQLSSDNDSVAAIASTVFEDRVPVLQRYVQDIENNETRFIVLSNKVTDVENASKTSLLFLPQEDRPGLLYDLLHEFAIRKLNLTRIESRRDKVRPEVFTFYLDVMSTLKDPLLQEIFTILEVKKFGIKVLGSYQSAK